MERSRLFLVRQVLETDDSPLFHYSPGLGLVVVAKGDGALRRLVQDGIARHFLEKIKNNMGLRGIVNL